FPTMREIEALIRAAMDEALREEDPYMRTRKVLKAITLAKEKIVGDMERVLSVSRIPGVKHLLMLMHNSSAFGRAAAGVLRWILNVPTLLFLVHFLLKHLLVPLTLARVIRNRPSSSVPGAVYEDARAFIDEAGRTVEAERGSRRRRAGRMITGAGFLGFSQEGADLWVTRAALRYRDTKSIFGKIAAVAALAFALPASGFISLLRLRLGIHVISEGVGMLLDVLPLSSGVKSALDGQWFWSKWINEGWPHQAVIPLPEFYWRGLISSFLVVLGLRVPRILNQSRGLKLQVKQGKLTPSDRRRKLLTDTLSYLFSGTLGMIFVNTEIESAVNLTGMAADWAEGNNIVVVEQLTRGIAESTKSMEVLVYGFAEEGETNIGGIGDVFMNGLRAGVEQVTGGYDIYADTGRNISGLVARHWAIPDYPIAQELRWLGPALPDTLRSGVYEATQEHRTYEEWTSDERVITAMSYAKAKLQLKQTAEEREALGEDNRQDDSGQQRDRQKPFAELYLRSSQDRLSTLRQQALGLEEQLLTLRLAQSENPAEDQWESYADRIMTVKLQGQIEKLDREILLTEVKEMPNPGTINTGLPGILQPEKQEMLAGLLAKAGYYQPGIMSLGDAMELFGKINGMTMPENEFTSGAFELLKEQVIENYTPGQSPAEQSRQERLYWESQKLKIERLNSSDFVDGRDKEDAALRHALADLNVNLDRARRSGDENAGLEITKAIRSLEKEKLKAWPGISSEDSEFVEALQEIIRSELPGRPISEARQADDTGVLEQAAELLFGRAAYADNHVSDEVTVNPLGDMQYVSGESIERVDAKGIRRTEAREKIILNNGKDGETKVNASVLRNDPLVPEQFIVSRWQFGFWHTQKISDNSDWFISARYGDQGYGNTTHLQTKLGWKGPDYAASLFGKYEMREGWMGSVRRSFGFGGEYWRTTPDMDWAVRAGYDRNGYEEVLNIQPRLKLKGNDYTFDMSAWYKGVWSEMQPDNYAGAYGIKGQYWGARQNTEWSVDGSYRDNGNKETVEVRSNVTHRGSSYSLNLSAGYKADRFEEWPGSNENLLWITGKYSDRDGYTIAARGERKNDTQRFKIDFESRQGGDRFFAGGTYYKGINGNTAWIRGGIEQGDFDVSMRYKNWSGGRTGAGDSFLLAGNYHWALQRAVNGFVGMVYHNQEYGKTFGTKIGLTGDNADISLEYKTPTENGQDAFYGRKQGPLILKGGYRDDIVNLKAKYDIYERYPEIKVKFILPLSHVLPADDTGVLEQAAELLFGKTAYAQERVLSDSDDKIAVVNPGNGYRFITGDGKDAEDAFFVLGGASQSTGGRHITAYHKNFMPLVEPIEQVAPTLKENGHNTIKLYLPPNNLTGSDAAELKEFITSLYAQHGIRTFLLHFGGLYADPDGEFLLNNPTPNNLQKVKSLIGEFAGWVKGMGPAVAGVQIGNENDYYVRGAGAEKFGSGVWDKVNLTAAQYYAFMNELAGVYKRVDKDHPVFLGHGRLVDKHRNLLQGTVSNYDGLAVNVYPNWGGGRPASSVQTVAELEGYFRQQVGIAGGLGKPLLLGEFGESSYGSLGKEGQAQFARNATEALSRFMAGARGTERHAIVGMFWHEYFPEYWKDQEIHRSESDLALFDPRKGFAPKPAFDELSRGYMRIQRQLSGQKIEETPLLKPDVQQDTAPVQTKELPQGSPAKEDLELELKKPDAQKRSEQVKKLPPASPVKEDFDPEVNVSIQNLFDVERQGLGAPAARAIKNAWYGRAEFAGTGVSEVLREKFENPGAFVQFLIGQLETGNPDFDPEFTSKDGKRIGLMGINPEAWDKIQKSLSLPAQGWTSKDITDSYKNIVSWIASYALDERHTGAQLPEDGLAAESAGQKPTQREQEAALVGGVFAGNNVETAQAIMQAWYGKGVFADTGIREVLHKTYGNISQFSQAIKQMVEARQQPEKGSTGAESGYGPMRIKLNEELPLIKEALNLQGTESKAWLQGAVTDSVKSAAAIIALHASVLQNGQSESVMQEARLDEGYVHPLHNAPYTIPPVGEFEANRNGRNGSYEHRGVDFYAEKGTPVYAAKEGVVILAADGGVTGHERAVAIRHSDGFTTLYGHFDSIAVSVGDRVTADTRIGTVGNAGNAKGYGYQLHFEARPYDHEHFDWNLWHRARVINPLNLLLAEDGSVRKDVVPVERDIVESTMVSITELFEEKRSGIGEPVARAIMEAWDAQGAFAQANPGLSRAIRSKFADVADFALFVYSHMPQESSFNPHALGGAGEKGLMQIKPGTWRYILQSLLYADWTDEDIWDPYKNTAAGIAYFADHLSKYGTLEKALAAYNQGPNHPELKSEGRIPDSAQGYVRSIMAVYAHNRSAYPGGLPAGTAEPKPVPSAPVVSQEEQLRFEHFMAVFKQLGVLTPLANIDVIRGAVYPFTGKDGLWPLLARGPPDPEPVFTAKEVTEMVSKSKSPKLIEAYRSYESIRDEVAQFRKDGDYESVREAREELEGLLRKLINIKRIVNEEVPYPRVPAVVAGRKEAELKAGLAAYLERVRAYEIGRALVLKEAADLQREIAYDIWRMKGSAIADNMREISADLEGTRSYLEFKKMYDLKNEMWPSSYSFDYEEDGWLYLYDLSANIITYGYSDTAKAKQMLELLVYFYGDGREGYANAFNLSHLLPRQGQTTGPLSWLMTAIATYEIRSGDSSFRYVAENIAQFLTENYRLPEGWLRFSRDPKRGEYDIVSTEQNISAYAAYNLLYQLTGNAFYRDVREGIFGALKDRLYDAEKGYFRAGYHVGRNEFDDRFASDIGSWAILALGDRIREIEPDPLRIISYLKDNLVKDAEFDHPTKGVIELDLLPFSPESKDNKVGSFEWSIFAIQAAESLGDTAFASRIRASVAEASDHGILPYASDWGEATGFGWNTARGPALISTLWHLIERNNINVFSPSAETGIDSRELERLLAEFRFSEEKYRRSGVYYSVYDAVRAAEDIKKNLLFMERYLSNFQKDYEARQPLLQVSVSFATQLLNQMPFLTQGIGDLGYVGLTFGGEYGGFANLISPTVDLVSGKLSLLGLFTLPDAILDIYSGSKMGKFIERGGILQIEGKNLNIPVLKWIFDVNYPEGIQNITYDSESGKVIADHEDITVLSVDWPWEKLNGHLNKLIKSLTGDNKEYPAIVFTGKHHKQAFELAFMQADPVKFAQEGVTEHNPDYVYFAHRQGKYQYIIWHNVQSGEYGVLSEALMFTEDTREFLKDSGLWMNDGDSLGLPSVYRIEQAARYVDALINSPYGGEIHPLTGAVTVYRDEGDIPVTVRNENGVPYNPWTGNIIIPSLQMGLIRWAMQKNMTGEHTFTVMRTLDKRVEFRVDEEIAFETLEDETEFEYKDNEYDLAAGTKYLRDGDEIKILVKKVTLDVPLAIVYAAHPAVRTQFIHSWDEIQNVQTVMERGREISFNNGTKLALTPGTQLRWYYRDQGDTKPLPGIVEYVHDPGVENRFTTYRGKLNNDSIDIEHGLGGFRERMRPQSGLPLKQDVTQEEMDSVGKNERDPRAVMVPAQEDIMSEQQKADRRMSAEKSALFREYLMELMKLKQMSRGGIQALNEVYEKINRNSLTIEEAANYMDKVYGMEFWREQIGLEMNLALAGIEEQLREIT
ncbi:MAG: peptidoglycan DD-metalloendopeptidase family protein, partial [Candidatus Omnitrophica bacterium]|nr:peptidoglycan DD-metalloendopeptidase family protein [Candidatus Omnitrophota bacterium]